MVWAAVPKPRLFWRSCISSRPAETLCLIEPSEKSLVTLVRLASTSLVWLTRWRERATVQPAGLARLVAVMPPTLVSTRSILVVPARAMLRTTVPPPRSCSNFAVTMSASTFS